MSVVLVRHGETAWNAETAGPERIRSWSDVPLAPLGIKQAKLTAQQVAGYHVRQLYSSDLSRAVDTAAIWAKKQPAVGPVSTHMELRPWHLGELIGEPVSRVQPLMDWYQRHADVPVPGGESLSQFLSRTLNFLLPLIHDKRLVGVVTHLRNVTAVEAMLSNSLKPFTQKPTIKPGGHLVVQWSDKRLPSWRTRF